MALNAYMSITALRQGEISKEANSAASVGPFSKAGQFVDKILVLAYEGHTMKPTDAISGMPTGSRIHLPTKFTKYFDRSSPLLWNALASGEELTKVSLDFYRQGSSGVDEHFFTVSWETCLISSGKSLLLPTYNPTTQSVGLMEEWSFTYKTIRWNHLKANTSGSDSWLGGTN